ncbi:MAG: acetate/propionate family kinase [Roseiflexaceae bacterium]
MSKTVLVLNAGSSSIKFTVYGSDGAQLTTRYNGQIEELGNQPHVLANDAQGQVVEEHRWKSRGDDDHRYALKHLSTWLDPLLDQAGLIGVGHRVVHGGPEYSAPTIITEQVVARLESYVPLAPLHQPANLAGIRAAAEFLPGVPQVACFDTTFHRQHPRVADQFALPVELYNEGVRRYGFHGLSYEYIVRTLPDVAPELAQGRVVVAHLGNGASMCAIHAGRSIDTTMSFTALDGLPMGTRCGDLDPGVVLYLLQEKGMDPQQVQDLLYKRSGLLGMSGISNDMRALLASDDPRARQAVDYFVYRIGRELGALTAALGGLDGFVFTAGIGEHAAEVRARICRSAGWLGVELDEAANQRHGPRIASPNSRVSVWVIPTDEDRMIALHTLATLQ